MMQNMAAMGRNGDTQLAHVSPGEMVVPRQVLNNRPELNAGINAAIMDMVEILEDIKLAVQTTV